MCRPPKQREQTFSREYVERLRAEAKEWRRKAAEERSLREIAEKERDAMKARDDDGVSFSALALELRKKIET